MCHGGELKISFGTQELQEYIDYMCHGGELRVSFAGDRDNITRREREKKVNSLSMEGREKTGSRGHTKTLKEL